jgi:hypothetical protein
MEIVRSLTELPATPVLAVIINCGTKWVSSLALASTLRHAQYPTLVIDCESSDGSREHFRALASAQRWNFYWLDWPLRRHGAALDALFGAATAESLLLVDSDAELLSGEPVRRMAERLNNDPGAYGAGFLQTSQWLGAQHGLASGVGWYEERMWIPFVRLRTDPVRAALTSGTSFLQRRRFLEFPEHPLVSAILGLRFWVPGLRSIGSLAATDGGPEPDAATAAFVECDTGALMHRQLRYLGYCFLPIDQNLWSDVTHHHGITRRRLTSRLRRSLRSMRILRAVNAASEELATRDARCRLAAQYQVEISALTKSSNSGADAR